MMNFETGFETMRCLRLSFYLDKTKVATGWLLPKVAII